MAKHSGSIRKFKCEKCGISFTESQSDYPTKSLLDGMNCPKCSGSLVPDVDKDGRGLTVKIDIDFTDALKGLKAVQREAKKTAQLLKEVENRRDVKDLSDDELLDEFRSRGWIVEDMNFHAGDYEEPLYRQVEMHKNNENQEE